MFKILSHLKNKLGFHYRKFKYKPNPLILEGNWNTNTKKILLISHELSRTGAPLVLLDAVKILKKNNFFPVILSPQDGPLKQKFIDTGAKVIIDTVYKYDPLLFKNFAKNFDIIIVNTLACYNAIKILNGSIFNVLWWIHEGNLALNIFKKFLPKKLENNIKVFCVSKYTKEIISHLYGKDIEILPYGISDSKQLFQKIEKKNENLKILCVGSIQKRKGQDILLKAIKLLPKKYFSKFKLYFIGNILEEDLLKEINDIQTKHTNIEYIKPIPKHEVYKIMSDSDIVVTPSRDDPMPCTVTEALMFEKICICSTNCGNIAYIKDKESGFIFENENAEELSKILMYVIDNYKNLDIVKRNGRKIFETSFVLSIFENNFLKIINKNF